MIDVRVSREKSFRHQPIDLPDEVHQQNDENSRIVREIESQHSDDHVLAKLVDPDGGPIGPIEIFENDAEHEKTENDERTLVLVGRFLLVASVVNYDVIQSSQQDETCYNVNQVLSQLIEMPVDAADYNQSHSEDHLDNSGQAWGLHIFIWIDYQELYGFPTLSTGHFTIYYKQMSGTGEKRELKQLMSNLHEMLRYLGESDGDKLVIKIDQFEYLRRDFIKAAEDYERASVLLPNTSDRKQRGVLLYQLSNNRSIMDSSLRQMMAMCMKMNEKIKSGQHKKKKEKDNETGKLEDELQYKNLTVYQLQNTYFKLTKKEHKDVAKHKNDNYPEQLTLEELKLRKPLKRGFSEETDPESAEYLKQKQILDAIKYIDARIQQKMDYILDGLRMLNYNAVTISESIGVVHKKIIINVENLDENLQHVEEAQKLLEEAAPLVSKPNCIMNVIIVALLGVLAYFIVKKVMSETNQA